MVKNLTAEQAQRLGSFTEPFHKDGECPAETAIRMVEELREEIRKLKEKDSREITPTSPGDKPMFYELAGFKAEDHSFLDEEITGK